MSKQTIDKDLRQCLADIIYDIDDGRLTDDKLKKLQSKISNKIYTSNYVISDRDVILDSVIDNTDKYMDKLFGFEEEIYTIEDLYHSIYGEIEALGQSKSMKDINSDLKSLKNTIKEYKKQVKLTIKALNSNYCEADNIFKNVVKDANKDLKKVNKI